LSTIVFLSWLSQLNCCCVQDAVVKVWLRGEVRDTEGRILGPHTGQRTVSFQPGETREFRLVGLADAGGVQNLLVGGDLALGVQGCMDHT
jgi:hypothetical protein